MDEEDLSVEVRCVNPEEPISIYKKQELIVTHKPTGIKASCGYFGGRHHKNLEVCKDMIEYGLTNKGIYYG